MNNLFVSKLRLSKTAFVNYSNKLNITLHPLTRIFQIEHKYYSPKTK